MVVDVDHEVSSGQVLHDEADVVAGLEAAVQAHQERVSGRVDHLEDPLLAHQAAEGKSASDRKYCFTFSLKRE